jgi:hypothetical protein
MFSTRLFRCFAPAILIGSLASACTTSNSNPINVGYLTNQPTAYATPPDQPGRQIGGAVYSATLLPAGNYALTTMRERPRDGDVQRILCQAPSPDWATALAMQAQLQGSGNFFSSSSGSLAVSGSTAETISAMAGRTAGVTALRDGLYNVCQAYANGVIGKDAYALALSTYSYLLVALAGGSGSSTTGGSSGGGGGSPSSVPPGVAVAVNTGAAAPAANAGGQQQQNKGPDTTAATAAQAQLQMQIMHALATACISANDPTMTDGRRVNPLLDVNNPNNVCTPLIGAIAKSAAGLMTPISLGTQPPKPPPVH